MGEIFDRNVHPLYAVMAFVSAVIVLILLLNYLRNTQKGKKHELLAFFGFIIFYCIQDGSLQKHPITNAPLSLY